MHAILEASATGKHIELTTTCDRPAPLPAGLAERELDASARAARWFSNRVDTFLITAADAVMIQPNTS